MGEGEVLDGEECRELFQVAGAGALDGDAGTVLAGQEAGDRRSKQSGPHVRFSPRTSGPAPAADVDACLRVGAAERLSENT